MNGGTSDFDAFRASRNRFFDRLAADSLLFSIERGARRVAPPSQEDIVGSQAVLEGDLVITGQHRLIIRRSIDDEPLDLADAISEALGLRSGADGSGLLGRVRITVERLAQPSAPSDGPGR